MFFFYSFQFRKIIIHYKRLGYNSFVLRQSACLVFNSIMVDNYVAFFYCTPMGRASDFMMADLTLFILVGWDRNCLSVAWPTGVQLIFFPLLRIFRSYLAPRDLHRRAAY